MGKKKCCIPFGRLKTEHKTLAAKQVVTVVGGWGISKREWERSEKKGLDLQASEKAREKVGGQKKRWGVRKNGLGVRKKGWGVRKKGLWVRKKGCGSEKRVCGSKKKESQPKIPKNPKTLVLKTQQKTW